MRAAEVCLEDRADAADVALHIARAQRRRRECCAIT
jgi:hypothetical protein